MYAIILVLTATVIVNVISIDSSLWMNKKYHFNNLERLNDGWQDCPDWPPNMNDDIYITTWGLKTKLFRRNQVNDNVNITAKCITIQVPLDWNNKSNDAESIDYFITHIFSNEYYESFGQLWVLNGGPGGDGEELYSPLIPVWEYINGSYDIFIPDHRGTGYSSQIYCPLEIINTQLCVQYVNEKWGDKINYYSTYAAAMDLGYAITLFSNITSNNTVDNTIIYGLSYGTYWLNQYMQLFPNQVDAVILDGVCPSSLCRYAIYDVNANDVGRDFMTQCEENQFCVSQFDGISPYDFMSNIFFDIDYNNNGIVPCINYTNTITSQQLRILFFILLANFDSRVFIPPVLYRLNRCNQQDIIALNTIFNYFFPLNTKNNNDQQVLTQNIMLSEMFYGLNASITPPSSNQLLNEDNSFYFATYAPAQMRPFWDTWNKYTPNTTVYDKYGDPSMSMLLLNGDLDPQTPYFFASYTANQYNCSIDDIPNGKYYKNRYFLTVPRSAHVTMASSPMINNTNQAITCGLYIIKSFIESTDFVPDNSCINWVLPIDWKGVTNVTMQLSKTYFQTTDMWGI